MTEEKYDLAMKIAERLTQDWAIGDFSRFMDEPADFDQASSEDIAEVIREVMAEHSPLADLLAALKALTEPFALISDEVLAAFPDVPHPRAILAARAAIARATTA